VFLLCFWSASAKCSERESIVGIAIGLVGVVGGFVLVVAVIDFWRGTVALTCALSVRTWLGFVIGSLSSTSSTESSDSAACGSGGVAVIVEVVEVVEVVGVAFVGVVGVVVGVLRGDTLFSAVEGLGDWTGNRVIIFFEISSRKSFPSEAEEKKD
jgi:hypothetical protein